MEKLLEFLPLLLPLILIQLGLLAYTLYHILTHKTYRMGNRTLWLCIALILCNYIGPILYFVLGRENPNERSGN